MADYAVDYIKQHAKSGKPFFMDVNWIKMHNPINVAPDFRGRSYLGDYSDSLMEMDADIGKVLDEIRADAPNTIVILTADSRECREMQSPIDVDILGTCGTHCLNGLVKCGKNGTGTNLLSLLA